MTKKFDQGKCRLDLVDPGFIEATAYVLTMGAEKYGPNNWQTVEDFENRYYAALMRHLMAWRRGEKKDAESGLSHLWHAACNIMFLIWRENAHVQRSRRKARKSDTTYGGVD